MKKSNVKHVVKERIDNKVNLQEEHAILLDSPEMVESDHVLLKHFISSEVLISCSLRIVTITPVLKESNSSSSGLIFGRVRICNIDVLLLGMQSYFSKLKIEQDKNPEQESNSIFLSGIQFWVAFFSRMALKMVSPLS